MYIQEGECALTKSAFWGHARIVEILLGHDDILVNQQTNVS